MLVLFFNSSKTYQYRKIQSINNKEFDMGCDTYAASNDYRIKLKVLKDSGRTDEYLELCHAPKRVAVKIKGLKKVLHPVDQWVLKGISKLPKSSSLENCLVLVFSSFAKPLNEIFPVKAIALMFSGETLA